VDRSIGLRTFHLSGSILSIWTTKLKSRLGSKITFLCLLNRNYYITLKLVQLNCLF